MSKPNRKPATAGTFTALLDLDARVASYGLHALSPFWRGVLERFYAHATARRLVARVGRGGAKSMTAVRVAVFETLCRAWAVPAGEVHYFAVVSALKEEAAQRRQAIRTTLDALGIAYESAGDAITLTDRSLGLRVFASSGEAVRGFRCVGYIADELAYWPAGTDSADPAGEVLSSLDAMCITHPEARSLLISSPWGVDGDEHARLFALGDTADQIACHAATWEANPGVTREQCLTNAKGDPRAFRRDYEAIPAAVSGAALAPEDLARAFDRTPGTLTGEPFVAIDASNLNHDAFAWAILRADDRGVLCLLHADAVQAHEQRSIPYVIGRIADDAIRFGAVRVVADQYASAYLPKQFADRGLVYERTTWTADSKMAAVDVLRRLLREDMIALPAHAQLKAELYALQSTMAPSGREIFATNGRDFAACLVTACMAIVDGFVELEGFAQGADYSGLGDPGTLLTSIAFGGFRRGADLEGTLGDLGELHVRMAHARTRERATRAEAEARYRARLEDERAERDAQERGRQINWPELYDVDDASAGA